MTMLPELWERSWSASAVGGSVQFPGAANNHLSTPSSAPLQIVGDLCMVVLAAADDWTPAVSKVLAGRRDGTTTNSYRLLLTAGGLLQLAWSPDGTDASQLLISSTAIVGATDGAWKWVAVTFDVDDGALGRAARFWLSDDGVAWTQLGATVTQAGVTSIFAGSATLAISAQLSGTSFPGSVSHVSIRNGIGPGGTVGGLEVFRFDAKTDIKTVGASTITASTGQVITVNRSGTPATKLLIPQVMWDHHDNYIGPVNVPDGAATIRSGLA